MDSYRKVESQKVDNTPIQDNEIRIKSHGRMHRYITYAMILLQERGLDEIIFKAMGQAISKTVIIVEMIKRRISGLHQITSTASVDIRETWKPLQEGLDHLQITRHVPMITITLSNKQLDESSIGYQPPNILSGQVSNGVSNYVRGRGRESEGNFRGRGRRGYIRAEMAARTGLRAYNQQMPFLGRGHGRGRGTFGSGRGRINAAYILSPINDQI